MKRRSAFQVLLNQAEQVHQNTNRSGESLMMWSRSSPTLARNFARSCISVPSVRTPSLHAQIAHQSPDGRIRPCAANEYSWDPELRSPAGQRVNPCRISHDLHDKKRMLGVPRSQGLSCTGSHRQLMCGHEHYSDITNCVRMSYCSRSGRKNDSTFTSRGASER